MQGLVQELDEGGTMWLTPAARLAGIKAGNCDHGCLAVVCLRRTVYDTVFKRMQHCINWQPAAASCVERITDAAAVKLPVVVVMRTSCGLSFDIQLM